MIVADTSAILALIDADDRHHAALRALWEEDPDGWVIPWAVLPEVDYLLRRHLGHDPARLFLRDVCDAQFIIEPGQAVDIARAAALDAQYADLGLGLVDGVVIATAERLEAQAIATLDVRHFGAVNPPFRLFPRDL